MALNPPPSPPVVPPRTISATMLVVALLITAGIAVGGTAAYFELNPAKTPAAPGVGTNRTTVVDDLGRSVSAPVNASRIVVLSPSIMDIVYRLGLGAHVVGVGCTTSITGGIFNEYTPNQTALWGLTNASCVTDYPSLNTAGVALLLPQLVLASTITSVTDVQTLTQTYGIPVVILAPSTLEGIVRDVQLVSQMFPYTASPALSLESALEVTLANATSFDTNLSNDNVTNPSVLLSYYFYTGEYYTYGPGTFGQSLLDLAGGSSISAGLPLQYEGLNASSVLLDQPDVILYGTSWNDPYIVSGETPAAWASGASYWGQLNGTKIAVDIALVSEADPTMILALPWFLYWLHPTLYSMPSQPPP
ncbi:MAG: ABC transporter substrate-binding protein [Thermoplasmata archaeon]